MFTQTALGFPHTQRKHLDDSNLKVGGQIFKGTCIYICALVIKMTQVACKKMKVFQGNIIQGTGKDEKIGTEEKKIKPELRQFTFFPLNISVFSS